MAPRLRLWLPLRAALCLLAVGILTQPQLRRLAGGLDLFVLLDRSASTGGLVDQGLPEWKKLLERSGGPGDALHYFDFADEAVRQQSGETLVYTGNTQRTRTPLAIASALASSDPKKPSRILVFTDGYSTEPMGDLGDKLAAAGVSVDYRLLREAEADDFRVRRIGLPERAQIAEPFVLEIEVAGTVDGRVPVTISRNETPLSQTEIEVVGGIGTLRFTDRIPVAGAYRYTAVITPPEDAHLGNNRFDRWVEIAGGPRVVLATAYPDDPVAGVLAKQGFDVQVVTDLATLNIGTLSGCRAFFINNLPAWDIPNDVLGSVEFFVRSQGGGFLMAGGQKSFGAGGYFQSAIDPLLPVSMEMKNEHRKLAVAMAIVMDRSGSMTAAVGGGATKMELANEGSARAVELLGGQDAITVYAVDSEAHLIVPIQDVGPNRDKIRRIIRRIESTGGGIFVYNGLAAAWKELQKAEAGQRHIVLFTDAADSEQPGNYEELVKEMVENGGSVSVIGLGNRGDADAAFIEDIAKRGNGRMFFTERPQELPNIFAQETVAVARSAFIKEPVPTTPTGGWFEISSGAVEWPPTLDGYNLSYLREGATAALVSADEYAAPLVAFENQGLGRTSAVSFPLGGDYSETARSWPGYGDFLQTLTRWLMGDTLPPGIGLRHQLDGTRLSFDLLYEDDWQPRLAKSPPEIILATGTAPTPGSTRALTWQRMEPGRYSTALDLPDGTLVRGAVRVGNGTIPFGPISIGTSAEWAFDPDGLTELRTLAERTGGQDLADLRDAWRSVETPRYASLQAPLIVLFLLLLIAEALVTRMGWRMPKLAISPRRDRSAADASQRHRKETLNIPAAEAKAVPQAEQASPEPPAPPPATDSDAQRRSRFKRAKR